MQTDSVEDSQPIEGAMWPAPEAHAAPQSIAPAWHTLVLIAAIAGLSVNGASRSSLTHGSIHRLPSYALTAAMELILLGWVAFGLRLKKIPLRSLLGESSTRIGAIALDMGIALLFWFGAMMVLGMLAVLWTVAQASLEHRSPLTPDPHQQQSVHVLAQLAPAGGIEIAAWILLCALVGVCEEIVFRGYLQTQFTRWARGTAAAGVLFSALVFGGAHAYEGLRSMILLGVFGALFSGLVLMRRGLRAAMIAHAWHDLVTGLALALLKSHGLI